MILQQMRPWEMCLKLSIECSACFGPDSIRKTLIQVELELLTMACTRMQPGNTIWLPSKNAWTLIDFGCASRVGEAADLSFSLWYAPPEVVQAYKSGKHTLVAAPSADVWSLGV